MDDQGTRKEVFRRSWLTTLPEWTLAGTISLAIGLAAQHFGLQAGWEGATLMGLPILWAGGRTLQWACRTWTVTPDRRLTARQGVLLRTRQVIHLASVSQVRVDDPAPGGWLGAGHVSFEATDPLGRRRPFRWTWIRHHERLGEILQARGQAAVGRSARWQVAAGTAGRWLAGAARWAAARLRRVDLHDYGRFMAFCHHVLRAERGGQWPPRGMPRRAVRRWLAVLRRVRVVVRASNERGWRLAGGIESLEDIRRRLGPGELQRAVRWPARFGLQRRWAT